VDAAGNAYVVGYTVSPDFPLSGIGSSAAIFASKLNAAGSELDYTVAVRSGSANAGHGITLDNADNVYVTGAIGVPADVYVAKLTGNNCPGDMDGDGVRDLTDFSMFANAYGSSIGQPGYDFAMDFDSDGVIDLTDFGMFAAVYGIDCP
jgi:hypothetical protein